MSYIGVFFLSVYRDIGQRLVCHAFGVFFASVYGMFEQRLVVSCTGVFFASIYGIIGQGLAVSYIGGVFRLVVWNYWKMFGCVLYWGCFSPLSLDLLDRVWLCHALECFSPRSMGLLDEN